VSLGEFGVSIGGVRVLRDCYQLGSTNSTKDAGSSPAGVEHLPADPTLMKP